MHKIKSGYGQDSNWNWRPVFLDLDEPPAKRKKDIINQLTHIQKVVKNHLDSQARTRGVEIIWTTPNRNTYRMQVNRFDSKYAVLIDGDILDLSEHTIRYQIYRDGQVIQSSPRELTV
jgi:hypothetical protein